MFKNQKGITLIALVITIIVLLILAGITIALIAGQNSAPEKAGEGRAKTAIGAAKDAINMQAAANMSQFYDEKYVKNYTADGVTENNQTVKKLAFADEEAATLAAGTQATGKDANGANTPAGSTSAVDGVSFEVPSSGDNQGKIVITYTADTTYTSVGTVTGSVIKWKDSK